LTIIFYAKGIYKKYFFNKSRERKMNKNNYKKLPEKIKKQMLMEALLQGEEVTAYRLMFTLGKDGLHSELGYSTEVVKLLGCEDDIKKFGESIEDEVDKFSRTLLKKVQAFCKECGFAALETDKDGKVLWPDEPTSLKIDLEDNDD